MERIFRFGLGAALMLALTSALFAAPWVGGRGSGNAGAYPETPFPQMPALVWRASLGSAYANATPSNALATDTMVIVAFGSKIVAVSRDTGEIRWTKELNEIPTGDILLLDNQLVITRRNEISAYDPSNGVQIWKQSLFSMVANSPFFTADTLVVSTKGSTLEVIARKTGKPLASVDVSNDIDAAPLLIGKSIVLCYKNGNMARIEGGINRWAASLPEDNLTMTPSTDGKLVIVTGADAVYSVNTASTRSPIRWRYVAKDLVPESTTIDDGRVYFASTTGRLFALDGQTGSDLWPTGVTMLPAPATASPTVIGEMLFVRMQYGLIAAYAKDSGALRWTYRVPGADEDMANALTLGAPAVDGDDLFFGVTGGVLCRFTARTPDVAPPTFRKVLPTMAGYEFAPTAPLQYIGAIITDDGSGIQSGSVTLQLDGNDLTAKVQYDPKSGYFFAPVPAGTAMGTGRHQLLMTARDQHENLGTLSDTFYVGNAVTTERLPIVFRSQLAPQQVKIRPGTILEWVNAAATPCRIVADDARFTSDTQFPSGIPAGERWIWVVPADLASGTHIAYQCLPVGADGQKVAGQLEIVDLYRDYPGFPRIAPGALPAFPLPDFLK